MSTQPATPKQAVLYFLLGLVIAAIVIGAFAITGTMDYDDAVQQEQLNCEMVKQGTWPREMCPDVELR